MWIAASVVWLVGAGAVLQKDIRRDVATLVADRSVETTQNKTLTVEDAMKALRAAHDAGNVEDAQRLAGIVKRRRQALSNSGQEDPSASPGSWKEAPLISEAPSMSYSLAIPRDTRTRFQRAQDSLMLSAIILLLPPILLFTLGWAGLWIVRGFRS